MWFYMSILLVFIGVMTMLYHFAYRKKVTQQLKTMNTVLAELSTVKDARQKIVLPQNAPLAEVAFSLNQLLADKNEEIYKLQQTEQSQRTFLNHLSHDIRTPLTSLIGYLDAFDKGYLEKNELQEYLPLVLKKAEQLKLLTDQLFFWFKLEDSKEMYTDTLDIKLYDLNELTRECAVVWIPLLEQLNLTYQFEIAEEALPFMIDRMAYTRIIENLLNNCVQHSQAKRLCLCLKSDRNGVRLIIEDDGIGISEQDQPFIFQKLYRCDSARSQSGSGLGLAITKELVRRLGGNISVKSQENQGCMFEVWLSKNDFSTKGSQDFL
ncbi:sensor histidine kinase [Enterococcus sp. BWR-S5]|uniref:sensor histidine kinase n=1 Tax=Enterococcus sp. BWR-S5 TaxID=2787714 RepID=UPI00192484F6|nr:HAMP domain-containing sensor histidine kinase [Enterococcus sp. BWR-S5]MBL1226145.1 HAMP domain-containing histidine kinase [Enterococcus sp. BWR-S5]